MNICIYTNIYVSLVAQTVKNLPPMQQTWVLSLSQEDPLEKEVATHCSIFAGVSPWTEKPSRLSSMGSQRVRDNWTTNTHTHIHIYPGAHVMKKTFDEMYWAKLLTETPAELSQFRISQQEFRDYKLSNTFPCAGKRVPRVSRKGLHSDQ